MKQRATLAAGQRGFSLIVSLILLVLITLVALASMRAVAMQTRMSATTHDRNLAFQAAETALREAEATAIVTPEDAFPTNGTCVGVLCSRPTPASSARWSSPAFTGWTATTTAVSNQAATPEAFIEYMGKGPKSLGCSRQMPPEPTCFSDRYRITARSTATGRATVLLQSDATAP